MLNLLSSIAKSAVVLALLAAPSQAGETPVVQATRTSTPPNIDGRLDDSVWHQAPTIADFFQREPIEGAPPTEQTEVRILFDDDHLYFALRCFDSEADRLVANQMRRDAELDENDNIQIILDPYNDRRGGFYFSTNPLGARQDLLLTDEGRTRNQAWDSVWQSRTRIDSLGWSAEVAIPFDQVRYPDSDQAVWGINIGRAIRRKNEEVFLVPPPQSYGFRGRYRTSRLAVLTGLGQLQSRPPLAVVPFLLSGTQRDFAADGSTEYDLDPGLDFKYGLTPSLTLDLSYKTDFAQVEADQEQINLTRFSLFFPEKRDFFLEGAGIFEFGERVERQGSGGRPPTLLFYSRRIGIEEGHNLPVLAGGKLTGRAGPYQIGTLRMTTQAMTFVDEEENQEGREDTILDTLHVAQTDFTVLRIKRDMLGRSNLGFIAIDKQPGSEANYNRTGGVDFTLSLLQAALNLRGFAAKTWTPQVEGRDRAGLLELDYRQGRFETRLNYLDMEEDFAPEVGFVPRTDIRRFKGSGRYRPRPDIGWIRMFSIGPRFTYLMDRGNTLQSRDFQFSAFVNLEIGDWFGARYRQRYELLDEAFEIRDEQEIPIGAYEFGSYSLNLFANSSRRLSGRASYEYGDFFNGTRQRISAETIWRYNARLELEGTYEFNHINLPNGAFNTHLFGHRFLYSFSPDMFVRGFLQSNSAQELVGGNFLFNYRYLPGSDLFIVYNQVWDTEGGLEQASRSLQLKVSYYWQR
ncbi:MAG: carbohydrate binding family 9 domain-containing protein [Gemmatimonadetes bacterium]|nr:carbohydrate binding family 9 domain-containing protein [Gemmatimonadota bacterium]MYB71597.1 carbohydrate binding family 9 domain-containing protein [Gemmatimonadota bacterium]